MSFAIRAGRAVLAAVLIASVFGASVALAADRTVTDPDHVSETFEEEGVYETVMTDIQTQLVDRLNSQLENESTETPAGVRITADSEEIAAQAVTESYIAGEFEQNIQQLIAYLEGDSDSLTMNVDLASVQEAIAIQFDADTVTVDTVAVIQNQDLETEDGEVTISTEQLVRLNEEQAGYNSVRRELGVKALANLPVGVDENGSVTVDAATVAQEAELGDEQDRIDITGEDIVRLNDGPTGYREVREDIRKQARSDYPVEPTEGQVDVQLRKINEELRADAEAQAREQYGENVSAETLDNIIALQNTVIDGLTDPDLDEYSAYADRRDSDERALEQSLNRELDQQLRATGAEVKADAEAQAREEYGEQVSEESLDNIVALQNTVIDGLTHPELRSFVTYEERRDENKSALETSLAGDIGRTIEEQADEQIWPDGSSEDSSETQTLRSGVTLLNQLMIALPLLTLILLIVDYGLTRSLSQTGLTAGIALLLAGILGVVAGIVGRSVVIDTLTESASGGDPVATAFSDGFVAVIESLFGAVTIQSIVVALVGAIVLAVVYTDRAGYLSSSAA